MTREAFLKYMKDLKTAYMRLKSSYIGKTVTLKLSDGKSIKIQFYERHVAHLLGINFRAFKENHLIEKSVSSFELLTDLMKRPEYWYTYITKTKQMELSTFISPFYIEKVNSIKGLPAFQTKNISLMCQYVEYNALLSKEEKLGMDAEYFILFKNKHTYSAVGLSKNQGRSHHFFPITNMEIPDEKLGRVLANQNLVLPLRMDIQKEKNDSIKTYELTSEEKIRKLKLYREIEQSYNCTTSLIESYTRDLTVLQKQQEQIAKLLKEREELLSFRNETKSDVTALEVKISEYEELKMALYGNASDTYWMDDFLLETALDALTNIEYTILCKLFGLHGYSKVSKRKIYRDYEGYNALKIQKMLLFLKKVHHGLITKDPYAILLTDRDLLKKIAFTLPKEQRDVLLFKHGLLFCERMNNKTIEEVTGIPARKVTKIREEATKAILQKVK